MTHQTPARSPELNHCIKCGREIAADESLCVVCNRAGMATPSASQYHGTVVVAIVLAIAGLAIAASFSLRGVGPYQAQVTGVEPAEPVGYTISYVVTNDGTRSGRAKCQLVALGPDGEQLRTQGTVTSPIDGGRSSELTATVPGLDVEPTSVTIDCS